MDAAIQSDAAPEPSEQTLTPLQAKAEAYRFDLVATLRSIGAVSVGAALILETNGPVAEMVALIQTLDRLQSQAGAELTCLGAALGSRGSA